MNRKKAKLWARCAVWGTLAAVSAIGCNPLNLAAFVFARDEKIPAEHPLTPTPKDGAKPVEKDEVTVVLLTRSAGGATRDFPTADRDLTDKLSRRLPELAKESKKKIKVVSAAQVDKFKMSHPAWKQMEPTEIGEKLGADFVLDVWLDKLRLYQPNTPERIYEGHAEVTVSVYETGPVTGFKDRYSLSVAYPIRPADAMPESQYKNLFVTKIAEKVACKHVETKKQIGVEAD